MQAKARSKTQILIAIALNIAFALMLLMMFRRPEPDGNASRGVAEFIIVAAAYWLGIATCVVYMGSKFFRNYSSVPFLVSYFGVQNIFLGILILYLCYTGLGSTLYVLYSGFALICGVLTVIDVFLK